MIICPNCGFTYKREVRTWPFHCQCGTIVRKDGTHTASTSSYRPTPLKPRTENQVVALVLICSQCEYFRIHDRVGSRCTHKLCQCGSGTEAMTVAGITINSGLVNLMVRGGHCPAGKWLEQN